MLYRNPVAETAEIIKSNALNTVETKLAATSLIINYTERASAEHALETLERKRNALGINRVESVYSASNSSYNVIPYFKSIEEMEDLATLLVTNDTLMA